MKPVIKLEHVWKIYRMGDTRVEALKDVNLEIKSGEYVAVMGPSGSGKSTLMYIMGCLDRPTKGKVYIDGTRVLGLGDKELARVRGRKIGFVFQNYNLIPSLNAVQNVELPLIFSRSREGVEKRKKFAIELLKRLDMGSRLYHRPNQLSGGQQQRVAIARALVNDPSIILADEPTGNLDSKSGEEVLNVLRELNDEGKTIVIVTHERYVAKQAERVIKIRDGRVRNAK